jgi:hypothetical protein
MWGSLGDAARDCRPGSNRFDRRKAGLCSDIKAAKRHEHGRLV